MVQLSFLTGLAYHIQTLGVRIMCTLESSRVEVNTSKYKQRQYLLRRLRDILLMANGRGEMED